MGKIDSELLLDAENFISEFFDKNLPEDYTFHTIEHTRYVAEKCEWIGENNGLSKDEINLAVLCAWFHDAGYVDGIEGHESRSADIVEKFLKTKDIDIEIIKKVKSCILATRIPQKPEDIPSQVLCDADMAHLADDDYFKIIEKLRSEWNKTLDKKFNKRKFYKISEEFFGQHNYFTDFARKELEPKKSDNLRLIEKEISLLEQKNEIKFSEKKQKKAKGYARGVESMFRNTARMQINLSSIADNKSNILISVNAIIISITMTVLVSRFEETPNIIIPTLIFLFFSLVTIVFAILSTRPHISSGTFRKSDIKKNKVNLLFFGNFYNMDAEDYEWAVKDLMKDEGRLYSTMILDQHSLGKVLAKKYKLLRVAYNVFMAGIIISVVAFVLAFLNI
jgi:predicted metal-dependent HD superfamily phosphohydrolase